MQNKTLRRLLADKTSSQISRLLKRLRPHGLIKKVGRTYKYYLTRFGKQVITTGLMLRELVIIRIPRMTGNFRVCIGLLGIAQRLLFRGCDCGYSLIRRVHAEQIHPSGS